MYETGGMRRVWVRGHDNVRKRVLIQAPACNMGAALLRRRPNQSLLRRRGRRQLDPSTRGRGEEAAREEPVSDGTCAVSDRWGVSAGTRALRGRSQYASKRRLPVAP